MRHEVHHEEAARSTQPSSFISLLSGWIQQGMESFFATQKILMDVATRQNTNTIKAMRESLSDPTHSPGALLKELAVEGTANFIEAQRILLDLGQKENEILLKGVKERVGNSTTASAMADLIRRSIGTFLEMQQDFLTIASHQAQLIMQGSRKAEDQDRMVNFAREGMEKFVNAQKQFLDVIAEETEKMTGGKVVKPAKETKKTELSKLAYDSAMALVEAQKKMLDLSAQQMNVNVQIASRASEMATPLRVPIAKITGDGVRSFVDAEKALIETMSKRRQPGEPTPKAKRVSKRPRRKPYGQAARAAGA